MDQHGTLFLVPTPVGNLSDMTFRGVEVLQSVDLIACEDTRTSATLLRHYGIDRPRTAYHQHNEHRKTKSLVEQLKSGKSIALITDAGTPSISDPGFMLVRASIENGIRVEALPGPTSFVPALAASGLPTDKFVFEGFLPPKKGRASRIERLSTEERTIILFESPHRLQKLVKQLIDAFGADRPAVVCREISKKFETYHRGTLQTLTDWAESETRVKGEIVLILAGKSYYDRLRKENNIEEIPR